MNKLIGHKVIMKQNNAKWFLENPEIYVSGSGVDTEYETETLIHLICCLGESVRGKIIEYNPCGKFYLVKFKVSNLTATYWVERNHIEVVCGD